ncbi:MAG TPA: hypothetical protein VLI92_03575 [Candidatus Saccharimonadales bacterium]|nr:hypothetical protein [Candidatus Saccharimonadales bacterium]
MSSSRSRFWEWGPTALVVFIGLVMLLSTSKYAAMQVEGPNANLFWLFFWTVLLSFPASWLIGKGVANQLEGISTYFLMDMIFGIGAAINLAILFNYTAFQVILAAVLVGVADILMMGNSIHGTVQEQNKIVEKIETRSLAKEYIYQAFVDSAVLVVSPVILIPAVGNFLTDIAYGFDNFVGTVLNLGYPSDARADREVFTKALQRLARRNTLVLAVLVLISAGMIWISLRMR